MSKKPKITPDDLAAFHKAVANVKPLAQKKIRLKPHASSTQSTQKKITHDEDLIFTDTDDVDTVQQEAFLAYKQADVAHKSLRKLRKGQYNVEAVLDLHGMSVEIAKNALIEFLHDALHEGKRVVLIIHGKGHHGGMPVLKNKLNLWLRQTNNVLAFCSATPKDGSRGAVYVLLKRKNVEEKYFE